MKKFRVNGSAMIGRLTIPAMGAVLEIRRTARVLGELVTEMVDCHVSG